MASEDGTKDFAALKRSRSSHVAQLTKSYKDIERKMISKENANLVKELFDKLCEKFDQFKTVHLQCLEVCTDTENMDSLEQNYESNMVNYMEFRERFSSWIVDSENAEMEKTPAKTRTSSIASSRTSVSSRTQLTHAKTKRLIAEMKMKNLKAKLELENEQRALESKQRLLEQQTELEEAMIEESVLAEVIEEDERDIEDIRSVSDKINSRQSSNSSVIHVRDPESATKNQQPKLMTVNNNSRTEEDAQIQQRQEEVKIQQRPEDVNYAFQRLAATLQEGFNLPKPELLTFNGAPASYLKFVKNFETNIEGRINDSRLRLSYLIQYCEGEAKEAIEDCVLLEPRAGYERARTILESRYGRPHIIVRSYIDNLVHGPPIKSSEFESLSRLALEMHKCQITLSQLGYVSDIDNSDNLRKIVKRLPMHLRVKWVDVAQGIIENGREPRFSDLSDFIEKKSKLASSMYGLDLVKDNSYTCKKSTDKQVNKSDKVTSFALNNVHVSKPSSSTQDRKCICCNGTCNYIDNCKKFKSMSLSERYEIVSKHKLCFNCLRGKHFVKDCRKNKQCSVEICKYKHHNLLHKWVETGNDHTATKVSINCSASNTATKNCLGIIPVIVNGSNGKTCQTYALIDDGADKTLCDERLVNMLELDRKPVTFKMTTATSNRVTQNGSEVDLQVRAQGNRTKVELSHVWSVKYLPISTQSAASRADIRQFMHLSDIEIPDIKMDDVLLLIGTDAPEAHIPLEVRCGKRNDPYAIRTKLGWIVRGPIPTDRVDKLVSVNFGQAENELLQQQLEKLWTTDFKDIGKERTCMSVEDKRALKTMDSTVTYEDGHYKLGLPWSSDDVTLPNNLPLAHARLQQLQRKLSRDDKLHEMYTATVNDYINKGYATEVTDVTSKSERVWYLPHHPVINENKPGKVRVVFDCAAKYKDVSLNMKLLQGPDLMNNLVGVLVRFRQDHIAVAADVEAMFHQVGVKDEDCDALRFLWWPNGNLKLQPKCYKMQVHLFGATSSPSCATYALKKTAIDNNDLFGPEVTTAVDRNFYVDDLLKSVDTEEKACTLATDLREITKRGGFRLTKWMSNSKNVIDSIPESERAPSVIDLKPNSTLPIDRALGVTWDVDNDLIKYKVKLDDQPATRRGITSTLSSIFDPLGLISPIIFKGNLILQSLSKQSNKLGWDDSISEEKKKEWLNWKSSLRDLENISIKRCFKDKDMKNISNAQLHVFSDGSENGYGACAYLRLEDVAGNINCSLVLGKARLAPLKQITIPRLELSGAVVACRLYELIRDELEIKLGNVTFWTDSMILLGYIKNESRRFKTFVANRLSVIHELTSPKQWRYVDTKTNPADIASRGISANDDKGLDHWLHGPSFLLQDTQEWPIYQTTDTNMEESDVELKKNVAMYTSSTSATDILMNYYSDWIKLKRSVAWLLRFKKYCIKSFLGYDRNVDIGRLNVRDMQEATKAILVHVQREAFEDEISTLESRKQVNKDSKLASLNPIIHDDLLKVKGRLDLSPDICPIILPKSHNVTTLIIRSCHECNGHTGMAQVLATLREQFWILKGPSTVRKVINRCIRCKRTQAPLCSQKMAPVIEDQKTPDKPPFTFVGTDYFGPINVKIGRSQAKRYGCLFTCLTTRAVHIEVAHSLTTDSFLSSFQRFTSRRGYPEKIYSDNGTNFVGGASELTNMFNQWEDTQISSYMSNRNIEWNFNPPGASHSGGCWERMIRTTRKILMSIANEQILTDEKLLTFMIEAERIINDRPITQVSNDPLDLPVLTPSMLLLMKSNTCIPHGVSDKKDIYARRWYKQIQYLSDVFWKRWIREYLPTLEPRPKWQRQQRDIKIDDIVLIADENVPRGMWPIGRVTDVKTSRDGHVRSCVIKTPKTHIERPITKLCLLECNQ